MALLGLALLAVACSSSGETTTTAPSSTTSSTQPGSTTSPPDSTTSTAPVTTTSGFEGDIGVLLERYREAPLRTTYSFGETQPDVTVSQVPGEGLSALLGAAFHIIDGPDGLVFCDVPAATCFATPGDSGLESSALAEAFLNPLLMGFLASPDVDGLAGLSVESEMVMVAGRTGLCFTAAAQGLVGGDIDEFRHCIDDELGFTLLFDVKPAGAAAFEPVMELIEFGDPLPTDFEPPFEVTELPGGTG